MRERAYKFCFQYTTEATTTTTSDSDRDRLQTLMSFSEMNIFTKLLRYLVTAISRAVWIKVTKHLTEQWSITKVET